MDGTRLHWTPLSVFFSSPSVFRSLCWFLVFGQNSFQVCITCSSSAEPEIFSFPGEWMADWLVKGSWVAVLFFRASVDVFPRPTRPQGCRWEVLLFHMRVTCSFWLEAFKILSLTLEFRNSPRISLGLGFFLKPAWDLWRPLLLQMQTFL